MRLIELVDRRYLAQWAGAGWEASKLNPQPLPSGAKVLVERCVVDAEEAAAAVARARGLER